jgi:hypothetical protein
VPLLTLFAVAGPLVNTRPQRGTVGVKKVPFLALIHGSALVIGASQVRDHGFGPGLMRATRS